MENKTTGRVIYRPEIDGLRALAVVAVIANHFSADILPSGFLGVDLFFVISGYVITASLASRQFISIHDVLISFYSRRVKRLVPALIFCIAVTSCIAFLFVREPDDSIRTGISALFGVSNIYLFQQSTDYFGRSADLNFFTHTWSLGVEEQFYLVFPFILWFTGFLQQRGTSKLFLVIALLSGVSLWLFGYLSRGNPNLVYFLTPFRFWELGVGCLVFLRTQEIKAPSRRLNSGLIFVLLIAVFFVPQSYQVPTTIGLVGLAALLIMSLRPATAVHSILTCRPVVYIGLLSYSLYLWHWSVLTLSRWTIGIHWWSTPVQLGMMLLLAWVSYKYIEKPLRHARWSKHKIMDVGYALFFSLVVALVVFVLSNSSSKILYLGNASRGSFGQSNSSVITNTSASFRDALSVAKKSLHDCNMTPHHLSGNDYRPAPTVNVTFVDSCLNTSNKKIVLVGDSFARVIGNHVAFAAWTLGYDFSSITGYGCPYPLDIKNIIGKSKTHCEVDSGVIRNSISRSLDEGDILVLRLYFPKPQYIDISEEALSTAVGAYDEEIRRMGEIAQNKGASMLIVGSNATAILPPGCDHQEWFNMLESDCDFIDMNSAVVNKFSIAHNRHMAQVAVSGSSLFSFVDPLAFICSNDQLTCPLFDSETHLMFDQHHLSSAAIDKFYHSLLDELKLLSKKP